MTRTSLLLVLALTTASACRHESIVTNVAQAGKVTAAKVESGIRITNNTDAAIAYGVRNPNWLGLPAICNDPGPACLRLAPGASVIVPFSEVGGYTEGTELVTVYFWHVVPDGAGYKADDPVEIVVPL